MGSDKRIYPERPILAASAAIFRDGRVLLAARGKAPMLGVYTLPGGVVEAGETLAEAAQREVHEEVGLDVEIVGFAGHVEVVRRDSAGAVERHFVICAFAARWTGGEPHTGDEALDIVWADPETLNGLNTTEGLGDIVAEAARLVAAMERA